jgi:hypothetical protein
MFFYRFQLHRQSHNHLLQVGDPFLLVTTTPFGDKYLWHPFHEFLSPAQEDLRPQLVLPADFVPVLDAGEFFQYHFGLELWCEYSSF